MAENVLYVRAKRVEIMRTIGLLPSIMQGKSSGEASDAARAVMIRVGMTALGRIRDAFVVKARGGTDDCGLSWPPLKPSSIAYGRRHPGVPKSNIRAAFRPSWMLKEKERKRWWETYRVALGRFRGDKSAAAKLAWSVLKREGAKTLIGVYGDTKVEILRDTGLLLNSLSPGVAVENQVFRVGVGEVIIGTNRKLASAHHNGIPGRLPQRRLWAKPESWPKPWWDDLLAALREGVIEVAAQTMKAA